ncbi:MAG TPA: glycerol-3-phosphate dehydrogenase [Ktedonobacterales bacterium]|nr:glycerol-3-phosphate dehydrogenase [Ktedonobacterales bacterium]
MESFSAAARGEHLARMARTPVDVLVIGGGITGAGVALDAAARGYAVALVERNDFASGTSSKSTKLAHGGIRYLPQFDFGLVHEALAERGLLLEHVSFLVRPMGFVLPMYQGERHPVGLPITLPGGFGNSWVLDVGLYLYDALAGRRNIRRHQRISHAEALDLAPPLRSEGLRNAFTYYDAQLDDARLTLIALRTAARWNAAIANHAEVIGFQQQDGKLSAAQVRDTLSGQEFMVQARHFVNAGGVWAEKIEALTGAKPQIEVQPSKGAHLVVSRDRLRLGDMAIVLPQTEDNRILFVIPWEGRAIIGTTDTEGGDLDHPTTSQEDIDYLIRHVNHYLDINLTQKDIISTYAGYRPLVRSRDKTQGKNLSRTHAILENPNGLVSIVGGKLTTWRRMAQDTVDHLAKRDHLEIKHPTEHLALLGAERWQEVAQELPQRGRALGLSADVVEHLSLYYGSQALALLDLIEQDASLARRIVPDLPFLRAEVVHASRAEMVLTLEDMLTRRTRIAIEDHRHGVEVAADVAGLMARELGWSAKQTREQIDVYRTWAGREELPAEVGI